MTGDFQLENLGLGALLTNLHNMPVGLKERQERSSVPAPNPNRRPLMPQPLDQEIRAESEFAQKHNPGGVALIALATLEEWAERVIDLRAAIAQYHIHRCSKTNRWARRYWHYGIKDHPTNREGWCCDCCHGYLIFGHCRAREATNAD